MCVLTEDIVINPALLLSSVILSLGCNADSAKASKIHERIEEIKKVEQENLEREAHKLKDQEKKYKILFFVIDRLDSHSATSEKESKVTATSTLSTCISDIVSKWKLPKT